MSKRGLVYYSKTLPSFSALLYRKLGNISFSVINFSTNIIYETNKNDKILNIDRNFFINSPGLLSLILLISVAQ